MPKRKLQEESDSTEDQIKKAEKKPAAKKVSKSVNKKTEKVEKTKKAEKPDSTKTSKSTAKKQKKVANSETETKIPKNPESNKDKPDKTLSKTIDDQLLEPLVDCKIQPLSVKSKISEMPSAQTKIHRLFSWNVNGARAIIKKPDSLNFIKKISNNPEVKSLCFQETKCDEKTFPGELKPAGSSMLSKAALNSTSNNQDSLNFKHFYLNSSKAKKGYSGTCIYTKTKPISNKYGMGFQLVDIEGRVITVEFEKYFYVTAYVPNSSAGLVRLAQRTTKFEPAMRAFLKDLDSKKPVIYCGDLNVACSEIELANPKSNYNKSAGYTQAEIDEFLLMKKECNFVDAFRFLYPDKKNSYTYWGYRMNCRAKNVGWRLDYFMVSERIKDSIVDIVHHTDVLGSDHCPIELILDI